MDFLNAYWIFLHQNHFTSMEMTIWFSLIKYGRLGKILNYFQSLLLQKSLHIILSVFVGTEHHMGKTQK